MLQYNSITYEGFTLLGANSLHPLLILPVPLDMIIYIIINRVLLSLGLRGKMDF